MTTDEALAAGRSIFDQLVGLSPVYSAVFDYYVMFDDESTSVAGKARWGELPIAGPVESDGGKELLERGWGATKQDFKRNLVKCAQPYSDLNNSMIQLWNKIPKMTDEWPNKIESESEYTEWVHHLASNAVNAAVGNAADASESGDLADTPESRLEYEVELEVDDKIGFAVDRSPRLFYDIARLSSKSLDDTATVSTDDQPQRLIENTVFNILQQDVVDEANRLLKER